MHLFRALNVMVCDEDALNFILPLQNHSLAPHWSIEHLIEEAISILDSFFGWFLNHNFRETKFVAHNV